MDDRRRRELEAKLTPAQRRELEQARASANGDVDRQTVDGAALLDDVAAFLRRYVVLSDHQQTAISLWVAHTWSFDAAHCTPYLSITSAEKESGKTLTLEVLELLAATPWMTGRATAAVLARKVDGEHPSLLLDESDAAFNGDQEYGEVLRGVLNSGYRRSGNTTVCVGQGANMSYKDFSTFCPKAIAGIGKLPDTVASRSIPIRLKRRARDERIERFRRRIAIHHAEPLREQLEAWRGNVDTLIDATPELPEALSDRAQDVWEPLLAIADLVGGDWPARAREAAVALHGGRDDDESIGISLLIAIKGVYESRATDVISSKDLVAALNEDDELPYGGWNDQKGITARELARKIKPYEVSSRTVRIGDTTLKGYHLEQFEDAFKRFIPPDPGIYPSQRHNPDKHGDCGDIHPSQDPQMLRTEKADFWPGSGDVTDVTDMGPQQGSEGP